MSGRWRDIYLNTLCFRSAMLRYIHSLRCGPTPWETPDGVPTNNHGDLPRLCMSPVHASSSPRNKTWRKSSISGIRMSDPRHLNESQHCYTAILRLLQDLTAGIDTLFAVRHLTSRTCRVNRLMCWYDVHPLGPNVTPIAGPDASWLHRDIGVVNLLKTTSSAYMPQ